MINKKIDSQYSVKRKTKNEHGGFSVNLLCFFIFGLYMSKMC